MVTGKKIRANIKRQIEHEGETKDTRMLLDFLSKIRTASQWNAFVNVHFERYGTQSFQSHRFYYPSDELRNLYSDFI